MPMVSRPVRVATVLLAISVLVLSACSGQPLRFDERLSGEILIDGSTTLAPLTRAIAAMFEQDHPGVHISVRSSGTVSGFRELCDGEIAIADASEPMRDVDRVACGRHHVGWREIPVANDAVSVVVNRHNPVQCVSTEQLKSIYGPQATATKWNQVPGLGTAYDEELKIFAPGTESGTFNVFTNAVNGRSGAQRWRSVQDAGENDYAIVTGVAESPGGIGYLGYSYFREDRKILKALQVRNSEGRCVAPSPAASHSGAYKPLSRQLFIYPSAKSLQRPEVMAFADFFLNEVNSVAPRLGFITLTDGQLREAHQQFAGSVH